MCDESLKKWSVKEQGLSRFENSHETQGLTSTVVNPSFLQAPDSAQLRIAENFLLAAHNELMMQPCGGAPTPAAAFHLAHSAKSLFLTILLFKSFVFNRLEPEIRGRFAENKAT